MSIFKKKKKTQTLLSYNLPLEGWESGKYGLGSALKLQFSTTTKKKQPRLLKTQQVRFGKIKLIKIYEKTVTNLLLCTDYVAYCSQVGFVNKEIKLNLCSSV